MRTLFIFLLLFSTQSYASTLHVDNEIHQKNEITNQYQKYNINEKKINLKHFIVGSFDKIANKPQKIQPKYFIEGNYFNNKVTGTIKIIYHDNSILLEMPQRKVKSCKFSIEKNKTASCLINLNKNVSFNFKFSLTN